ncbi:hypothetical protein [Cohnella sp. AR92]|uniref:hypothetical protein n=1 Tax=Cohnella sp. AR92 TaxID=648716 RepID=UPI000F8DFC74|nr:hypothetical protein [Cohnella sp. AR92]RUS46224.1 hypothetical protein ELR57_14190 [Cohnella sp. AR92]
MFIRNLLLVSLLTALTTAAVGCTDVRESVKSTIREVSGEQPEQAKQSSSARQEGQPGPSKQTGQIGLFGQGGKSGPEEPSSQAKQGSIQVQSKVEVKIAIDGEAYATYYGDGFSFDYPFDWEQTDQTSSIPEIKAQFSSPTQIANVLLITAEYKNASAPPAGELKDLQMDPTSGEDGSAKINDYKQISFEEKPYGRYKAGVLVSEMAASNNQSLIQTEYYVPIGKKSYSLIVTTAKEITDSLQNDIDHMIDSFEVDEE